MRGVAGPACEAPLEREAEDPAWIASSLLLLAMTLAVLGLERGEGFPLSYKKGSIFYI